MSAPRNLGVLRKDAIPYMVTFIAKTPFHHIVNILRGGAIPKKSYKRCRQIIGYTNQKN
ncbi:MAG TPA: hypothetical protein PKV59_06510 [Flexilinea sp.]|nr:hypothetical protein [Flexilinea sp.]